MKSRVSYKSAAIHSQSSVQFPVCLSHEKTGKTDASVIYFEAGGAYQSHSRVPTNSLQQPVSVTIAIIILV